MNDKSGFQLHGDAALVYESQKVPAIFRPLAEATLEALALADDTRVLDVACGTGIVARVAASRLGDRARVVGADLNARMVDIARECSAAAGVAVDYRVADVSKLPFEDASFDVAICQQGLQFFPDRPRALAEIGRVLAPGGRIAVTVWSEVSPLFRAMADAVREHVNDAAADLVLAPFAFRQADIIRGLLTAAGFTEVDCTALVVHRKMAPAAESVPREFAGSPVAEIFTGLEPRRRERLLADICKALARYETGTGLDVPQHTHLFQASRP